MTGALDSDARRLLWRCRRGMKELDLLLERFAHPYLADAPLAQRRLLARLLDTPDPDLADWLLGPGVCADPELAPLVAAIRGMVPPTAALPTAALPTAVPPTGAPLTAAAPAAAQAAPDPSTAAPRTAHRPAAPALPGAATGPAVA